MTIAIPEAVPEATAPEDATTPRSARVDLDWLAKRISAGGRGTPDR